MEKNITNEIERLRKILNNVPVGIEVYDNRGYLLDINQTGLDIFGVSDLSLVVGISILDNPNLPKQVLSNISTFLSLSDHDRPSFSNQYLSQSFLYEYSFNRVKTEKYYNTKFSDKIICISAKLEFYFNEKGEFENLLIVFSDETEKFKEQVELKKFKLMFDNISEFGKVGIMEENVSEDTFMANDQWYENFGVSKDVEKTIDSIYRNLSKEDVIWLKSNYKKTSLGRIPFNAIEEKQMKVISKDKFKWIKCVFNSYKNEFGNIIILGSSIDVTEFVEATQKALASDRLKTKFLENITHEIHTPLNAIVGFSQLIVDAEDNEDKEEYKKIILENSDTIIQLVNNILDYSKLEAGVAELERSEFDICALVTDLFTSFKIRNTKNIESRIIKNNESIIVYSDKTKINNILNYLLNNAFKFTNKGYIEIGIIDQENQVLLSVEDSGKGISPEGQARIFERFYKFDEHTQGSGLGLPIAQKLVKLLGGDLCFESELGKGTKFVFSIMKRL